MPTPVRLAIASRDTSVPDSENATPAASISFWRVRAASARTGARAGGRGGQGMGAVVGAGGVKAEDASGYVLICASGNGGSLHFTEILAAKGRSCHTKSSSSPGRRRG